MTRCLLVADIHSNIVALDAVLAAAKAAGGFDEVWMLGDVVGYGPAPNECIRRIRSMDVVGVAGNHDLGATGAIDLSLFNAEAAAACMWTRQTLGPAEVRFLEALPLQVVREPFVLVHGSPRHPVWEYVVSARQVASFLPDLPVAHCLVGHTHSPAVYGLDESRRMTSLTPEADTTVELRSGRFLINPGAVGQPRDGDPRAAFALYDDAAATVTLHRVAYDIDATDAGIRRQGLPPSLGYRLHLGY